ncbi:MAG: enoyl-CoA hydratase-related protein, partial [Gammaproteobacteria bacterium]
RKYNMTSLVKVEWQTPTTALLQMQDLSTHNTLSLDFISSLQMAVTEINQNQKAKVVILTGLESHFCCGNAQLNYQDKTNSIHQLLLNCELPVIAALQGDALGDGLVLSAYADVIIMAEESSYSSHYANESFSPGMGATYILPKKFGTLLGAELLYSSAQYTGQILKTRNTPVRIVKKVSVLPTAMEIARDFDEKLSTSIRLLKQHITQIIKTEIAPYLTEEVAEYASHE